MFGRLVSWTTDDMMLRFETTDLYENTITLVILGLYEIQIITFRPYLNVI